MYIIYIHTLYSSITVPYIMYMYIIIEDDCRVFPKADEFFKMSVCCPIPNNKLTSTLPSMMVSEAKLHCSLRCLWVRSKSDTGFFFCEWCFTANIVIPDYPII